MFLTLLSAVGSGLMSAGSAVGGAASAAGGAIASGASAAGGAIASGASSAGSALAAGAEVAGSLASDFGAGIVEGAKSTPAGQLASKAFDVGGSTASEGIAGSAGKALGRKALTPSNKEEAQSQQQLMRFSDFFGEQTK